MRNKKGGEGIGIRGQKAVCQTSKEEWDEHMRSHIHSVSGFHTASEATASRWCVLAELTSMQTALQASRDEAVAFKGTHVPTVELEASQRDCAALETRLAEQAAQLPLGSIVLVSNVRLKMQNKEVQLVKDCI